ncbi:MAG: polymerase subunit sigma-24 [Proteobacteria bacterium]|nr:polymerase subunit sigma-24 [Pseudomonadota bacterium]
MRASAAGADRSPSPAEPPRTVGADDIGDRPATPGQSAMDRSPPTSSDFDPVARAAGDPRVSAERDAQARETAEAVFRAESRRVFATLVRLLGDFDLAEDALADAFRAALEQWPRDGVPANPRAWLVSAGRFKAIDGIRRRARFVALDDVADEVEAIADESPARDPDAIEDDRLRLIFTCCHPALSPDAQVALTLREVCGLTTEEIARAFLSGAPTLAQRIVRAKAKIRDARIPYQVPAPAELSERLESVLRVIYLVFNEGYSASSGASLTRIDLSSEAIRVGRLLVELLPEPEAIGLLALMLLQESRRAARASPEGDLILLDEQDRSLWNRDQIAAGTALVKRALASRRFGPYALQAAIAAVHAEAPSAEATDWGEIVGLYDLLLGADPSPVIELNRAVAVAMRDGPAAGLALIDAILARGDLHDYRLAHAARADLCRRLGETAQARASYERALALTRQEPEQRFLERRLSELA